jgi:hypothetical protein
MKDLKYSLIHVVMRNTRSTVRNRIQGYRNPSWDMMWDVMWDNVENNINNNIIRPTSSNIMFSMGNKSFDFL